MPPDAPSGVAEESGVASASSDASTIDTMIPSGESSPVGPSSDETPMVASSAPTLVPASSPSTPLEKSPRIFAHP